VNVLIETNWSFLSQKVAKTVELNLIGERCKM